MYKWKYILCLLNLAMLGGGITPGISQVFKTQEQALQEVSSEVDTLVRKTLFLDNAQLEAIKKRSSSDLESPIITYYVGMKNHQPTKYIFFEDKIVRSKKAIVMVVVSSLNTIDKMEVLAFYEPMDYLPIPKWFTLFDDKALSDQLMPGKGIHAVTGATLSVRAFTEMARQALAIQELIGKETP